MDLKSSYRLSCIVPIYNVEDYLEECVESLLLAAARNRALPEFVTRRELSGTDSFAELFRTGKFVPMATSYLYRRADSIMNTLDAGKRLNSLLYIANRLTAEARALCLPFYRIAHKKLKNYHSWLISTEVTEVPEVIPDETIVILFHNRMWEIPLRYPKEQVPEGILITSDQKYLNRADVVVFHLPH